MYVGGIKSLRYNKPMLLNRKSVNPSTQLFLNYSNIQQINCIKITSIDQEETEQSYQNMHLPMNNTNLYPRFNHHQHRKFINRHKIIHKIRSKSKPPKVLERPPNRLFIRRPLPLIPKNLEEGKFKQALLGVFDWMMELAALLKVTKNAFYRAIMILLSSMQADRQLASNRHIIELACAALAMGCKFECSQRNYLEEIHIAICRRVPKGDISHAQHSILKALDWCIPVHVEVEETLVTVLGRWGQFLRGSGGRLERCLYGKCFHPGEGRLMGNLFIEVVYILDFLVMRRCHEWLRDGSFIQPILFSLYMLFSIRMGDVDLDQHCLWPLFLRFMDNFRFLPPDSANKMKLEITRCASQYQIIQMLGSVPLTLSLDKLLNKRNEQFYIPKVECIQ